MLKSIVSNRSIQTFKWSKSTQSKSNSSIQNKLLMWRLQHTSSSLSSSVTSTQEFEHLSQILFLYSLDNTLKRNTFYCCSHCCRMRQKQSNRIIGCRTNMSLAITMNTMSVIWKGSFLNETLSLVEATNTVTLAFAMVMIARNSRVQKAEQTVLGRDKIWNRSFT